MNLYTKMRIMPEKKAEAKPMPRQTSVLRHKNATQLVRPSKDYSILHGPSGGVRKHYVKPRTEEMERGNYQKGKNPKRPAKVELGYTRRAERM